MFKKFYTHCESHGIQYTFFLMILIQEDVQNGAILFRV